MGLAAVSGTGFDAGSGSGRSYYAAVSRQKGRTLLLAAGVLPDGTQVPSALRGRDGHAALWGGEALVSALPGVAIEEAEEAFRWEVAKSGAVPADAFRRVFKRGPGVDAAPPFLGVAGDPGATQARALAVRGAGLVPVSITLDAVAFEALLTAAGKLPGRGTVLHVDVREGVSVLSAFGGAGVALRRTIRTIPPVSAENLAIDIQRSASYAERKLALPAAEAVYLTGDAVDSALVEGVARGLQGMAVEAVDVLAAVDPGPRIDVQALRPLGCALGLSVGLALLDRPTPDFDPPVERGARIIRTARRRARALAVVAIPLVLACAGFVRWRGPGADAALEAARAKYARVERLEKKSEELRDTLERTAAWQEALRRLGQRDGGPVATWLGGLCAELPEEAYLTELDVSRADERTFALRLRGEMIAADESGTLRAKDGLRRAATKISPGAQLVLGATRRVQGRVRVAFSIDATLGNGGGGGSGSNGVNGTTKSAAAAGGGSS